MSPTRITCALLACLFAISLSLHTTNAQAPVSQQTAGTIRLDVVVAHKNGPPVAGRIEPLRPSTNRMKSGGLMAYSTTPAMTPALACDGSVFRMKTP